MGGHKAKSRIHTELPFLMAGSFVPEESVVGLFGAILSSTDSELKSDWERERAEVEIYRKAG